MTTLHKVTELTKKFALGFVLGVIGIIFLVVLIQYIRSILPKKVEPPTVIFGQLPAMTFPQNTLAKNFSYTINTVSGTLPVLPDKVAVYKTSKPEGIEKWLREITPNAFVHIIKKPLNG